MNRPACLPACLPACRGNGRTAQAAAQALVLKLKLDGVHPSIGCVKNGFDAGAIYCQRADEKEASLLATVTHLSYFDNRPNAAPAQAGLPGQERTVAPAAGPWLAARTAWPRKLASAATLGQGWRQLTFMSCTACAPGCCGRGRAFLG